VELCVIPRSAEIDEEERVLDLTLVMVVGGTRPSATIAEVRRWITVTFGIPRGNFHIRRYHPEDIIVVFSFYDDMLRVLHNQPPADMLFSLIFKR
jgi:hypothetical protein